MREFSLDTSESMQSVHQRAEYICQFEGCNKKSIMVSHRIKKGIQGRRSVKSYLREKYKFDIKVWSDLMGKIIHHRLNTVATCENFAHNSSFLVSSKVKLYKLIDEIWESINE